MAYAVLIAIMGLMAVLAYQKGVKDGKETVLELIEFTMARSGENVTLMEKVKPEDYTLSEPDYISPEYYMAQGFADAPDYNIELDPEDSVAKFLHREGLDD